MNHLIYSVEDDLDIQKIIKKSKEGQDKEEEKKKKKFIMK